MTLTSQIQYHSAWLGFSCISSIQITFGSRPVVGLSLGIGVWRDIARVTLNIVGTMVNFHDNYHSSFVQRRNVRH